MSGTASENHLIHLNSIFLIDNMYALFFLADRQKKRAGKKDKKKQKQNKAREKRNNKKEEKPQNTDPQKVLTYKNKL